MRNESGIQPAGDRVLVYPDPIEEKTDAGIVLPKMVKDKAKHGQASGTLVAVGPDAFRHVTERVYTVHGQGQRELVEERVRGYAEPFARPGERIAYAKYSGLWVTGEDGKQYLILNDQDITAKVSDGVEFTELDTRKTMGVIDG